MPEQASRYVTTRAAAHHLGVCEKTFRKMLDALPPSRRPKQIAYPGVAVKRWRIEDLDSAFAAASASSGWDRLTEDSAHVEAKRRKRVGSGRGR